MSVAHEPKKQMTTLGIEFAKTGRSHEDWRTGICWSGRQKGSRSKYGRL